MGLAKGHGLKLLLLGLLLLVAGLACGGSKEKGREYREFANWTSFSKEEVWEAYEFARANPGGVLDYMPCYCGCGIGHGHMNNWSCYIKDVKGDGMVEYESHAAT
ncbi:MAG: hypothetical protein HYU29_05365 [Chloroflexi bacterium]|nr:hypothetical protein [Chloroflexota bacterium]